MDMARQQLFTAAGFAANQYGQGTRGQAFEVFAQLPGTGVDKYQRLGADAQGAFFGVGEGQQRLAEGFMQAHGRLPPRFHSRDGALKRY